MSRSVLVESYLGISLAVPSVSPSMLPLIAGIAAVAGLGIGIVIGTTAPTR
jgi:hypothetical protein